MSLKSIVTNLIHHAKGNEDRAFSILGAHPGPGFDLLIKPEEPLCGKWHVEGLTDCGRGFVERFWKFQPLSNQKVAEMRRQALEWGLTYQIKYQVLSLDDIETSRERT